MVKTNIITSDLIFLDENLVNKTEIIHRIAKKAKDINYLSDENAFVDSVMKREEEVPTAIGHGIAIPHGKTDIVKNPFIAFFRSKNKFKWTEGFEEEVQLIFQVGVPETGTEKLHLKFISEVSKKLLHEDFRNQLLTTKDANKVFELLNSIKV
ncbi:PTS sugar transporter subunit IIA [Streptococcus merionis]|uniref:PTS system transporter protein n=1 Tax=Streptococcus merionis TaxID=400065 RepID=A0A239T0I8_9STRE|nr:fructose PTS transporter subunit IIA [Streptococcus merionis]SNU91240.1 PTS system transporter protein [Streptococcus merionis]